VGKNGSVQFHLGRLSNNVRALNARMLTSEKKTDQALVSLARIEGALELRPVTAIPIPKTTNGTSPEAALSPEDRAALNEGRAWRGLGALLATARKNLLALAAVVLLLVVAHFQIKAAVKGGLTGAEVRKLLRESSEVVGPPAPGATP
jgi:hypothetical protein